MPANKLHRSDDLKSEHRTSLVGDVPFRAEKQTSKDHRSAMVDLLEER